MGQYTAPLRDMQFVLHELLGAEAELKAMPQHADIDADTINQVLEEAGKFCSDVVFPLNQPATAKAAPTSATAWCARPRASRKPISSTSKPAGRHWRAIRSTAARACRS
jgi:hypothetical protein